MIETVLKIDGMSCGMCESHINDVIRNQFKVKKVKSSHRKGLSIIISEEKLDHFELKNAISNTGYTVLGITEN